MDEFAMPPASDDSAPHPATDAAAIRRRHVMPFGAEVGPDGTVFRLFAPKVPAVGLAVGAAAPLPMERGADGFHVLRRDCPTGTRYRFVLPDGTAVPDPASRFQPDDAAGASEVVDPAAYSWADGAWRGRPWHEAVVYELHVGTFTPEGTFRAAIGRLPHLSALGVTAVQVMPVADFPGRRNWGYDGVLPFAPDGAYGRPEDFKAFVDAAHGLGLMVLLDVVYNHFGPEANFLPLTAPLFTERHMTPWGAGINFDGEGSRWIRRFVVDNALYWLTEFHLDGLRLDAVHGILDDSDPHILEELAAAVRAATAGRQVHLVLENEENEAGRLAPAGAFTAQWNDDVHHVLHTALTGEGLGYYEDYLGRTDLLGRALAEGFAFQGETMAYRGSPRGEPSAALPPTAFVAFLQNHDQVGNRAKGDRISTLAPEAAVRAAAAVYLLLPQVPMLFMGEEWGTRRPFPFFVGFEGELAEKVREGRRREFARFPAFADEAARAAIPDPSAEATFLSAKLDWRETEAEPHRAHLELYRQLLAVRRDEIVPRLEGGLRGGRHKVLADGAVSVAWDLPTGERLQLEANLSPRPLAATTSPGRLLWLEGSADGTGLGAWSVRWSLA